MSILLQSENIGQNNQNNILTNHQSLLNEEDTEVLKEKMKQLQLEIQELQKLKQSKNYSQKKSTTSKIQQSIQNQKPKTQKQNDYGSASILSQNLKNSKINDLVSQLSFKDQFPTKRKRSWSRTIPPQSQRNSVRNLKQTLQKIDISEQKKKKRIAAKIFNQKQQSNNVQSNIFNVTIAQIMAGQITKKQEQKNKMLSQIVDLKSKIKQLTTEKQKKDKEKTEKNFQSPIQQITARMPIKISEFNSYQEQKTQRVVSKINGWSFNDSQQNRFDVSFKRIPSRNDQNQFIETNRSNENTFRSEVTGTGKIYSRSRILRPKNYGDEDYQSITTLDYQFQNNTGQSIQLKRNSNPFTWNPEITLTLPQQSNYSKKNQIRSGRIYSSIQMQKKNQYSQEKRQQRTKPFFNIMKKKKLSMQSKKEEQILQINQKKEQKIVEIKLEERLIQKPKKEFKKLQQRFNLIKIDKMKNEPFPPKQFLPNFRQYINDKILSIKLPPTPTIQFGQSQLEQLGKTIFQLFDIFVDEEIQKKGIEYKVTKYKNCVLFRLNEEKNIVWYFDGRFYFGGWQINLIGEAKKEGFGFQIIPNKFIYQGFFKSSKRQGYGIMTQLSENDIQNKIIYEGQWKQGIKDGFGYQIQAQLQYLGDFKMGLQTGQCKIKTEQTLYQGEIKDSVKIGKGHEILRNGDEYYGDFENNSFNGTGQYRWKSGAYFHGSFVNGIRKGEGVWISNIFADNFDIYKGSYEDNKKNGYGVYQWANGTIYDGYFKNDLRHDQGMMIFPNGKAAKFIWKDGIKTTKLYCEEEQIYRRTRNSPSKVPQENQNQELRTNNNKQINQDRSNFSSQILKELENLSLHLYVSKKSHTETQDHKN